MDEIFRSERISFVSLSEELISDYLEMVNDHEGVQRFISREVRRYTPESEREWVRGKLAGHAAIFSMIERATGRYIGNIEYFDRRGGAAELGIAITGAQQERGFGKEAIRRMLEYGFEELGLTEVTLNVFDDNPRALHVYERCGFRSIGRGREEGDITMAIRREEMG